MRIQLSNTENLMYGNPLGFKIGEIRDIEPTMEIEMLLRAGVYVYAPKQTIPKTYIPKKKTVIEETKPIKLKIKGIGKKTLKDINTNYGNEELLKEALRENKVGLRDDVVEKLQKYYKVIVKKK